MRIILAIVLSIALTGSALAQRPLKEDTTVTVMVGPFLDDADGTTEMDALTGAALEAALTVSKNHAAFGARSATTDPAPDSDGWYTLELNATDTSTPGPLIVKFSAPTSYQQVWVEFQVINANVFDSLYGAGTEKLQTDTRQVLDTNVSENNAGDLAASISAFFENLTADAGSTASADLLTNINSKTLYLPSVTAGNPGGVFIAGSNAATTVASFTNTGAFTISGGLVVNNGSGNAATFTGSSNGHGLALIGQGTGEGLSATAGDTGNGAEFVGGATSGSGIRTRAVAGGGSGFYANGDSTNGPGIYAEGGSTGDGMRMRGGSTSGSGLVVESVVDNAMEVTAVGAGKVGVLVTTTGTGASDGIKVVTAGDGNALSLAGSGGGEGMNVTAGSSGNAANFTSSGESSILITGGSTNADHGIRITTSGTGSSGIFMSGATTGAGLRIDGGASAPGVAITGGNTSGNGITISAPTEGHGIQITAEGTAKHGIIATGASAGTSDGMKLVAGAAGGVSLNAAHLQYLFESDYNPASKPGNAGGLLNELIQADGTASEFTAQALEEAPTGGGGSETTSTTGTATAGSTTTITLEGTAVATANYYNGQVIAITGGTGAGQSAIIQSYTSGRVATLDRTLPTALASGSTYKVFPSGYPALSAAGVTAVGSSVSAIWDNAEIELTPEAITAISDAVVAESVIADMATKVAFLPSATAGAAGGLLIAGSNAATTFATLTSTGAMSIGGVSNIAQTGDSFARIGVAGAGLTNIDLPNQTMNITGTITGSVTGSVGSILNVTFPTNFGALGINASGHVSRVTLADAITDKADFGLSSGTLNTIKQNSADAMKLVPAGSTATGSVLDYQIKTYDRVRTR